MLDTAKFAITAELESVMGARYYAMFVDLAVDCFTVLRQYHALLINLMTTNLCVLPGWSRIALF
jgi:hypothetical protein